MTLPIAISLPHAGLSVPSDLRADFLLTPEQVVRDGDEDAAAIYDLRNEVAAFVTTDIARSVLDMNRASDDVRKDGITKTHSIWDEPVWRRPLAPQRVQRLLEEHHAPYHRELAAFAGKAKLAIDCHTMVAFGPPVGPDPGVRRPLVCLGDAMGTSCPADWIIALQACFRTQFGDDVTINEPFGGGYITRTHRAEMPWVQIELSRTDEMSVADKRAFVLAALREFCAAVL